MTPGVILKLSWIGNDQISKKRLETWSLNHIFSCSLSQDASNSMYVMSPGLVLTLFEQEVHKYLIKRFRSPPLNHIYTLFSHVKRHQMICRSWATGVVLNPSNRKCQNFMKTVKRSTPKPYKWYVGHEPPRWWSWSPSNRKCPNILLNGFDPHP